MRLGPELIDADVLGRLIAEWSIEVGRALKSRRQALDLTLEAVAALTGLSRQTIHRSERDAATLRDDARHRLAAAYQLEVGDLWTPIATHRFRRPS